MKRDDNAVDKPIQVQVLHTINQALGGAGADSMIESHFKKHLAPCSSQEPLTVCATAPGAASCV
jgi:hypothetical protein